ncbi:sugar phosphate isomerase/epimerase, partial [Listeria monocytogenes]|nr:sugar phosphate isomerase/epimerase [Listeria monocytogenes]
MKLGVVSAIFDQSNFEEMIDIVAANGLECVEVACWPQGK